MEYVVILEQGESSVGAYVPDLPGCVAVGETKEEAMQLIRGNGEMIPTPHTSVVRVDVLGRSAICADLTFV